MVPVAGRAAADLLDRVRRVFEEYDSDSGLLPTSASACERFAILVKMCRVEVVTQSDKQGAKTYVLSLFGAEEQLGPGHAYVG